MSSQKTTAQRAPPAVKKQDYTINISSFVPVSRQNPTPGRVEFVGLTAGWTKLPIKNEPINPLNQSSRIEKRPGDGVGWVWRDSDWGDDEVKQVYATDETGLAEYPE